MKRYICIHGHFYQPPRENPWLEEVEQQDSAYPYHDWNERITAECYAPNTASRIVDNKGHITDIVNNYAGISFNFGPTLLSWMERHRPDVYNAILAADALSRKRFSGHGSALAQVYNHLIMPLANRRDKQTQIIWGLKDFESRFKRAPEGMWLAETAVDLETLDIMAELGIRFTILAPHQARRVRTPGGHRHDVSGQKVDPRRPYLCRLPSGRTIALFFYDGPISLDVSFRNLLRSGETFADRLLTPFDDAYTPQLVSIATDGETYGHHHRFGEMALTYCLDHIESAGKAKITIFGEFLEKHPPDHEAELFENSSWSCSHGVERWKADCGCNIGTSQKWNQKWRTPLREAMDWLRDELAPQFEAQAAPLLGDPWQARDAYIDAILDRSEESLNAFFTAHAQKQLSGDERSTVLQLLEMQRNCMLMYTSCGWFFDDIGGIEATQIMAYAARAIQLSENLCGTDHTDRYLALLEKAAGNTARFSNGAVVYKKSITPTIADFVRVGAHYAISSLFLDYSDPAQLYCYSAESLRYDLREAGLQRLALGTARIRSSITLAGAEISFAILHLGGHSIVGGVAPAMPESTYEALHREIQTSFLRSNIAEVFRIIEKYFGRDNFSLWHLFRDEQRKILSQAINDQIEARKASFESAYKQSYPLMQVMDEMSMPLPRVFSITADFTLNSSLQDELQSDDTDLETLGYLIEEAKRWAVEIDTKTTAFVVNGKIISLLDTISKQPGDVEAPQSLLGLLDVLQPLELDLNLWEAQNIYFNISKNDFRRMQEQAGRGDTSSAAWVEAFERIGIFLKVAIT